MTNIISSLSPSVDAAWGILGRKFAATQCIPRNPSSACLPSSQAAVRLYGFSVAISISKSCEKSNLEDNKTYKSILTFIYEGLLTLADFLSLSRNATSKLSFAEEIEVIPASQKTSALKHILLAAPPRTAWSPVCPVIELYCGIRVCI